MPLYDILNEFQKGSSHMAAVVKAKGKTNSSSPGDGDKSQDNKSVSGDCKLTTPLLQKQDEKSGHHVLDIEKGENKPANGNELNSMQNYDASTNSDIEDGEVIGIITLEDVFEELLQEEIVDETDEYVDVHKRIRVAAAAAASSVARAPSTRRLTAQKAAGAQHRQGQHPTLISKKPVDGDSNSARGQANLVEPLLGSKR